MAEFEFTVNPGDGAVLFGHGRDPVSGARALVCLVHGLGDHSGRYGELCSRLEEASYAVMAFDMRGHGRSPGRRGYAHSCEYLLSDIHHFLTIARERYPGVPLYLYGHSFGGSLAIGYTLRYGSELDGTVASSPLLRPAEPPAALKVTAARILSMFLPHFSMSTDLDCTGLSRRPEVVEEYRRDPLVHDRIAPGLGIDILEFGHRNLEEAQGLSVPMLLMHGSADRITSPLASSEFASTAGERCRLHVWEGLYHEIHNEPEREQVFACLLGWLNERMEGTGVS